MKEDALVHSGVRAIRVDIEMMPAASEEEAEAMEFLRQILGFYLGMKKDLLISTIGAEAESAFKDAVDRLASKKKRGGMTADLFKPLQAERGFFVALDAERLLQELAKLHPENEDLQELGAAAEKAGRWVFESRLQRESLTFEFSMPFSALQVLGELDDDDEDDGHEHDDNTGLHHRREAEEHGNEAGHPHEDHSG